MRDYLTDFLGADDAEKFGKLLEGGPSKPSKPSFGGFDGPQPKTFSDFHAPNPQPAAVIPFPAATPAPIEPDTSHLSDFDFLCAELFEDEREALIERAAIIEYDGGLDRPAAEAEAVREWLERYRAERGRK